MKSVIKRDWSDIEPKVYAFLIGGGVVGAVYVLLGYLGVDTAVLPTWVGPAITWAAGVIAGYLKQSTVTTSALVPGDGLASPANTATPSQLTPGPDHRA
jgi:hypothetical protein